MRFNAAVAIVLLTACRIGPAERRAPVTEGVALDRFEIVDLTHALNAQTIFWPTSPTTFSLDTLSRGHTPGGWFYAANSFSMPEHGGTHLDAPLHFGQGRHASDEIPLTRLIGHAVVIDVTSQADADPDYRLSAADVAAWEKRYGVVPVNSIVLLRTGWSRRWPDVKAYLGDDKPGDATRLSFPSFGEDAVQMLVGRRRIAALGVDVASIDYGRSADFMVHRIAADANVPGLENLTNLERLPATGALVIALPVKIEGGTGGPVRVVALVPR